MATLTQSITHRLHAAYERVLAAFDLSRASDADEDAEASRQSSPPALDDLSKDELTNRPEGILLVDEGLPGDERDEAAQFPDADGYVRIRAMRDSIGGPMGRQALIEGLGGEPEEASIADEELDGMLIIEPKLAPPKD